MPRVRGGEDGALGSLAGHEGGGYGRDGQQADDLAAVALREELEQDDGYALKQAAGLYGRAEPEGGDEQPVSGAGKGGEGHFYRHLAEDDEGDAHEYGGDGLMEDLSGPPDYRADQYADDAHGLDFEPGGGGDERYGYAENEAYYEVDELLFGEFHFFPSLLT